MDAVFMLDFGRHVAARVIVGRRSMVIQSRIGAGKMLSPIMEIASDPTIHLGIAGAAPLAEGRA